MRYTPYDYQKQAIDWIIKNPKAGLLLDMGLGKTICTLSAIEELIYDQMEIQKVLIIAPIRVASSTWPSEILKWDNIKHLSYSVAVGTPKQRLQALNTEADIYIINRENIVWLMDNYEWDFDMVVIDELSSFKNNQAKRFKALKKKIVRCKRVVGLTGTPTPNGLVDLWPQIYLLDQGERLGRTLGAYRERYFKPGRSKGYIVYEYIPLDTAKTDIFNKLSDICISMKKEDYLDMPDRVYQDVEVELAKSTMKAYKDFEKNAVLELAGNDSEIVAVNAAAASNKLQQFANGAIYDTNREYSIIHDSKIEALKELIEMANGQPVIVFYNFKHDQQRIQKEFDTRELNTDKDIEEWNRGNIPILLAHPASIGHGLNLQDGGHIIIWFGLTWSLELYQQANDRLYRNGQKNTVSVYHIVAKDTIDQRILMALNKKDKVQNSLMEYMKAKMEELKNE